MVVRIIECGPFGCMLERGTAQNLEAVSDEYEVVRVEKGEPIKVYVDPKT